VLNELNTIQAEIFKSIAHPTRIEILQLLRHGERCVCEIFPALEVEQPTVSRHLSILKKEGIVSSRKDGLKVIYTIEDKRIFDLLDIATAMRRHYWEKREKALA
jgi:DNA-binding transcriptional ArsR family regulator